MPPSVDSSTAEALDRQLTKNATDIALIQQNVATLQQSVSNLASTVDSYIKADQASKRPNYALWIALGSLVMGLCAGGWLVLTLKINAETYPLAQRVVQLETLNDGAHKDISLFRERMQTILSQNQNSIDDRNVLNRRVDQLTDKVSQMATTLNTEIATRTAHEVEIETQFDADSQLRNTQFANQQRMNAIIWNQNKDKLGEYPAVPSFFPNISKRNSTKGHPVE